MNKTVLEKNVYYYEDSVDNLEELIKVMDELDKMEDNSSWTQWEISDYLCGLNKEYNISKINNLEEPYKSKMSFVYNTIKESFYKVCKDYGISVKDNTEPIFHPLFNVTKYEVGAGLGAHFDQGYDGNTLKYTLVMYLNDNYEGGEISFTLSHYDDPAELADIEGEYSFAKKEKQFDFGIKPKAGSIVVFPASPPYRHTAHTVMSGSKWMVQLHWLYNNQEKETIK